MKNHKIAVIILIAAALGFLFSPAEGASQVQYLSAAEIQNFINKYVDERPLAQVTQELGKPSTEPTALIGDRGLAGWYILKNRLSIVMEYNSRANTVKLQSIADFYDDDNLRERRYNQIAADFERIITMPPTRRTGQEIIWDVGDGWVFSVEKTGAGAASPSETAGGTAGRFGLMYRFGPGRP